MGVKSHTSERHVLDAIGGKIRTRRHELGLTLAQVSRRAGVSMSMLHQLEKGQTWASVKTLHCVCAALGFKLARLFKGI